jgi:hypothetical protein
MENKISALVNTLLDSGWCEETGNTYNMRHGYKYTALNLAQQSLHNEKMLTE